VVKLLQRAGYGQAVNVRGGIIEWMNQRLPVETADG
jgi:rhodanese-related sulfurtransferase